MSVLASSQSSATIGATDSTILGSNPSRYKLTVSPPSVGRVTLVFGRTAILDSGETIQAGTPPRTWSAEDVGDMITCDIHAIADAAGRLVGITESFVPRF